MEKSRKSTVYKILIIVIAAVLISAGLIIVIQRQSTKVEETTGTYSQYSDLSLEDHLGNNSLYGNATTLTNPPVIYTSISKLLTANLSIYYYDTTNNPTTISLIYEVSLISTNPSWTKTTYHSEKNVSLDSRGLSTLDYNINVSSNLTIGNSIDEQLGFSTSDAFSLQIQVYASSSVGASASNMSLEIGTSQYALNGPINSPLSGVVQKNVNVPGDVKIPLPNYVGYFFMVIAASLLAYLYYSTQYVQEDYAKKFLRENSKDIVELRAGPPDDAIQVMNTEDIMKIAMIRETPVFAFEDKIFTESNGKVYYAEIRKKKS